MVRYMRPKKLPLLSRRDECGWDEGMCVTVRSTSDQNNDAIAHLRNYDHNSNKDKRISSSWNLILRAYNCKRIHQRTVVNDYCNYRSQPTRPFFNLKPLYNVTCHKRNSRFELSTIRTTIISRFVSWINSWMRAI